jgi:hypothetical protein
VRVLWIACIACGGGQAHPPENSATGDLTIGEPGVGPLTGTTPATADAIKHLMPQYTVAEVTDGDDGLLSGGRLTGGLALDLVSGGDKVLEVVPYEDHNIYFIHALSPKIAVAGHAWRVGATLSHGDIDECECWGDQAICYKTRTHVAVVVAHDCKGMRYAKRTVGLEVIDGATIQRVVWSREPWVKQAREAFPGEED